MSLLSPRHLSRHKTQTQHSQPSSEPSAIVIIWAYQDMMEWMSRILVGEKAIAPMLILAIGSWAIVVVQAQAHEP
jgi:hypothetical protein